MLQNERRGAEYGRDARRAQGPHKRDETLGDKLYVLGEGIDPDNFNFFDGTSDMRGRVERRVVENVERHEAW